MTTATTTGETNPSRYSYKVWVTIEQYDKEDDTLCVDIDLPDILGEFNTIEDAQEFVEDLPFGGIYERLERLKPSEELPSWIDRHSVNCMKCQALVDERDCLPGPGGVGDICLKCLDVITKENADA